MTIQEHLNEREKVYGDFAQLAQTAQTLNDIWRMSPAWAQMTPVQRASVEMDNMKAARIMNGDPHYRDNWFDRVGYNHLAVEELDKIAARKPKAPAVREVDDTGDYLAPLPTFLTNTKRASES